MCCHQTTNLGVGGSNPPRRANLFNEYSILQGAGKSRLRRRLAGFHMASTASNFERVFGLDGA